MAEDWRKQNERSTPVMLRLIVYLGVRLPRTAVRFFLYPIVAYFLLTSRRSRRASSEYLRRVLQREPMLRDTWRHFFTFAGCTLDRILLLGNNHERISVDATWSPGIRPIVASGRGCLLIVAHFGSTEVLRFTPAPPPSEVDGTLRISSAADEATHIKTAILMDRRVGRMLTEMLEHLNPRLAIDVIDASARGPQLALKLKESLEAGYMVCLMADRVTDGEGSIVVNFLGGRARFAETPWVMAAALRVPVILGFGIYAGGNRYSSHFELFAADISPNRQQRAQVIADLARRYAQRLEHYVRLAPYNWFNFYDYWLHDPARVETRE